MTNVINLFGAPCSGKSTLALALAAKLKVKGLKTEYVEEYAKGQTYEENFCTLTNQIKVLGEQHHLMFRVKDKIDWIVTDSPFVMGMTYVDEPNKPLEDLMWFEFHKYQNHNFFLPLMFDYQSHGRKQTEYEAGLKEVEIKTMLLDNNIEITTINQYDLDDRVNAVLKQLGLL